MHQMRSYIRMAKTYRFESELLYNRSNIALVDPDIHSGGYLHDNHAIIDCRHLAVNSTGSYHLITFFQSLEEGFVLFCLFLLWADEKEIENREHENKRNETHKRTGTGCPGW